MTLQEIQYKAQGIIHKWRDDDSAPYMEFVEELAHMTVSEPSEGVVEAAEEYSRERSGGHILYDWVHAFIAGAKWQAEQLLKSSPLPEDTVLFNKGVEEGKRLMMEEAMEGEVMTNGFYPYEPRIVAPYPNCPYDFGDKVRVIVCKNED